jgi:hypothetical protein
MNPDRARDLFSAYRESELAGPLREAFEAALAADRALHDEYRSFDEALTAFEALRSEPVPEPYMLHERIVSKVDRAVLSSARNKRNWLSGWRLGLVGAVGAAALLAAVLNIDRGGPNTLAGIGPSGGGQALRWRPEGAGVRIVREPGAGTLRIAQLGSDASGYEVELEGTRVEVPVVNRGAKAQIYVVTDGASSLRIAVPGLSKERAAEGAGTVDDLALALAAATGKPVEVQYPQPDETVEWTLSESGPSGTRVSGAPVSVQELVDGRVVLN